MACAVPCIVPRASALAEWPKDGVAYMDLLQGYPNVNPGGVNTVMDTPKIESFIDQMDHIYTDEAYRKELGVKGYKVATKSKFNWKNIADQFHAVFEKVTA